VKFRRRRVRRSACSGKDDINDGVAGLDGEPEAAYPWGMTSQMRRVAIAAALVVAFFSGWAARAMQQAWSIDQVAADPGKFYGRNIGITGLARSSRVSTCYTDSGKLPCISFSLYEPSGKANYPFGKRYLSVSMPQQALANRLPADGQPMNIEGVLKPPSMVGTIEP
jgi:hypothetical protein